MVYEDFGGIFTCEFRGGDSLHISRPAEADREKEDVRISSSRDRQEPKAVYADKYSGFVGQEDGECRRANNLTRGFLCLTLEAASYTPFSASFHIYLPIEELQQLECACDIEVARDMNVASVHDSRSDQEKHINADDAIKGEPAPTAVLAIRRRGGG